jgi:hypothetical protein
LEAHIGCVKTKYFFRLTRRPPSGVGGYILQSLLTLVCVQINPIYQIESVFALGLALFDLGLLTPDRFSA